MPLNLACVGRTSAPYLFAYEAKDLILYALGVGATERDLSSVFEGDPKFAAVPSFAVIPATRALFDAVRELDADLTKLLHGEQGIRWFAPIPTSGVLSTTWEVTNVFDKGKGALAVVVARTADADGRPLFDNTFSLFVRGAGGFGGDRGPEQARIDPPADRAPDFRVEQATLPWQALLYRLSGDRNFLHVSPTFATAAGFERPILHGLCSFGFAIRALVQEGLGGDAGRLGSVSARFTGIVYPGDRIVTEGWKTGEGLHVLRVTTDRGTAAISGFQACSS